MALEARRLQPYRQAAVSSAAASAITAVLALGLWLAGSRANGLTHELGAIALPLGLLGLVFLVASVLTATIRATLAPAFAGPLVEEPLLMMPNAPAVWHDSPMVLVLGTAHSAGAATLAATLALLVATEGQSIRDRSRRPRPLCLWHRLPTAGGEVVGGSLAGYLAAHPTALRDDLVNLAIRHQTGTEFLGVGAGEMNSLQLRQLLPLLRRHYELIVFDGAADNLHSVDTAIELADVIVLVTPDSDEGVVAATEWAERLFAMRPAGKTVLAISRRIAPYPHFSRSPFSFALELPEAETVRDTVIGVRAWPLTGLAARQLRRATRIMLPQYFPGGPL